MNKRIFDPLRQRSVAATPEEIIRQKLLKIMIEKLGFPRQFIAIEKQLSALHHLQGRSDLPERRADIICFGKDLSVLLLIECKEGRITDQAASQALGYNYFVGAPFVGLAGIDGVQLIYPQKLPFLPSYQELLQHAHSS